MMKLPSLRHLWHLTALDEHSHFGRAAEACRVTQSTLSSSIKELEGMLETTLVDRSKRRVVLTPVGIETVARARRIIKEVEELVCFSIASREPLSGTLRMGTIPTIGSFLLPRVLPSLRQAHGRLRLYLVEDLTERLIDSLHRGQLDVVLLALPYDCGAVETVQRSSGTKDWSRLAPRHRAPQGVSHARKGVHGTRQAKIETCRAAITGRRKKPEGYHRFYFPVTRFGLDPASLGGSVFARGLH
jgi:DNA-binding transcriptional LysR family regulator